MVTYITASDGVAGYFTERKAAWCWYIATQYGWHGVGNFTWLAWHCDVILPVEMCQWVWQTWNVSHMFYLNNSFSPFAYVFIINFFAYEIQASMNSVYIVCSCNDAFPAARVIQCSAHCCNEFGRKYCEEVCLEWMGKIRNLLRVVRQGIYFFISWTTKFCAVESVL
jgi:hypothetical protein